MRYITFVIFLVFQNTLVAQINEIAFVSEDIDRFWEAYDMIQTTDDSVKQIQYINELYIDKGTEGLKTIMEIRNYTAEEYVHAINSYPKFWKSIRANTLKAKNFAKEIEHGVDGFRKLYPDLKTGKVYFEIGVFRTPGSTLNGMVVIGSEFALGDDKVVTDEFPDDMQYVKDYFTLNPIADIVFLNVHEFVHTQQVSARGSNVLVQNVREGVAEYIAELSTNSESKSPALIYGRDNPNKVKQAFCNELFYYSFANWLWNSKENIFNTRDVGYYVGYEIARLYTTKETDLQKAIKDMIELDYSSSDAVAGLIDQSGYLDKPVQEYRAQYEASQPKVLKMEPDINNKTIDASGMTTLTIYFDKVMNPYNRGFDYGPLGEDHVLRLEQFHGFSEDGKSMKIDVKLEADKHYQLTLTRNFRTNEGILMIPYLIDIKTNK